jgi:IS5 family transposase
MCGAGHNLRLILAALRLYCVRMGLSMRAVLAAMVGQARFGRPGSI